MIGDEGKKSMMLIVVCFSGKFVRDREKGKGKRENLASAESVVEMKQKG